MKIDRKLIRSLYLESIRRSRQAANKLLNDQDLKGARDDLDWVNTTSNLIAIAKKQHRLRLSVIIASACLVIAGLLWSLHIPSTQIALEILATDISFTLTDDWSSKQRFLPYSISINNVSMASMPGINYSISNSLKEREETIAIKGRKFSLNEISLVNGARTDLSASPKGLTFFIKNSTVKGEFFIEDAEVKIGTGNKPIALRFEPPETLSFETINAGSDPVRLELTFRDKNQWVIRGFKIKEVEFVTEYPIDSGNFESAIISGKVFLPQTNRMEHLKRGDSLILDGVKSRRVILSKEKNGMLVIYEGYVSGIFAGPRGFENNLMPTYLEFIYHQERLVFFWSAVVFIWGMLWSIRNLFY